MIEINDFSSLNEKIKAFRSLHKKALTNCFLMPDEIQRLAAQGKLFVAEYPEWLIIICDRNDYKNLYYYTTQDSDTSYVRAFMKEINCNDVFLDVVSRSGRGDSATAERLIADGIAEPYKSYQRMALPVKDVNPDTLHTKLTDGYTLSAEYCSAEEIHALWKIALDEKSTPLPSEKEIADFCKNGNLLTVLDERNSLCGVLVLDASARNVLIQHLAVSPLHRRKGLALSLMGNAIDISLKRGLNLVTLWVDRKNSSAIALYDRLNFKNDGMLCDQLYMKGN